MSHQLPRTACTTGAACRLAAPAGAGPRAAWLLEGCQGFKLISCLAARLPTHLPPRRFGWISLFLWIGSTIISYQEWRGSSVAGPPPQAPVIPNSSVGMV